jgi:DNA ligase (NAD+)
MLKSKIIGYLKKLDELDNAYYNEQSLIDDSEYDAFKEKVYKLLPPEHPRLDKVGHEVASSWEKKKHVIAMGSQNKVSSEDAIRNWVKKIRVELGLSNIEFVLQHKIDGFSLENVYNHGKLVASVTRGDGFIGEDINPNAKLFRQLPIEILLDKSVVTRGEGVLHKKDYDPIQDQRKKAGEKPYKNSRNAASGISRRLDGTYSKYIRVITYDINAKVEKETDKIAILQKMGFTTVETFICHSIEEIIAIYKSIRDNQRDKYPYEIDGLVLKLNDINLQEKLGTKKNRPEGQVALKFDSEKVVTTIIGIILQIGRTGKITPVVKLEPVDLMGSTITRASVHNFSYMVEMGIGIGAEVTIEKKGDIIPQVTEVIMDGDPFEKPTKCPSCGGPIEDDGVTMWCRNEVCKERDVNRIVYWIQALDMKGFSEKFVERLWDLGKIRSVSDLYKLTVDDFIAVDGIGEKTIKAFFKTMKDTSEVYLEKFITALGIPTCSTSTAEVLVERFGSWEKIACVEPSELEKISGFAATSALSVCSGIAEIKDIADDLLKVIKIKEKKKGILTGKSFCVTGSLTSMGRKEFQKVVVDRGGTAKDTVSEGLTYLVTNDKDSGSSKNRKAEKLGVRIINEDEFLNLIGGYKKKEEIKEEKKESLTIVSEKLF